MGDQSGLECFLGVTGWLVCVKGVPYAYRPFWRIRWLATQSPEYHPKLKNQEKLQGGVSVCHINLARNPKLRGGERQTEILVKALAAEGVSRQRVVVRLHNLYSFDSFSSFWEKHRMVCRNLLFKSRQIIDYFGHALIRQGAREVKDEVF